jgi:hypothetical protein
MFSNTLQIKPSRDAERLPSKSSEPLSVGGEVQYNSARHNLRGVAMVKRGLNTERDLVFHPAITRALFEVPDPRPCFGSKSIRKKMARDGAGE